MAERRLLDRVRNWGKEPSVNSGQSSSRMVASVTQHLHKLLNSKQGTTLMDEAYGLPDFIELTERFPDSVREIEKFISNTIQKYEPRLSSVNVEYLIQDDQNISHIFQIRAKLKTGDDIKDVYLESSIGNGGKMLIKG